MAQGLNPRPDTIWPCVFSQPGLPTPPLLRAGQGSSWQLCELDSLLESFGRFRQVHVLTEVRAQSQREVSQRSLLSEAAHWTLYCWAVSLPHLSLPGGTNLKTRTLPLSSRGADAVSGPEVRENSASPSSRAQHLAPSRLASKVYSLDSSSATPSCVPCLVATEGAVAACPAGLVALLCSPGRWCVKS